MRPFHFSQYLNELDEQKTCVNIGGLNLLFRCLCIPRGFICNSSDEASKLVGMASNSSIPELLLLLSIAHKLRFVSSFSTYTSASVMHLLRKSSATQQPPEPYRSHQVKPLVMPSRVSQGHGLLKLGELREHSLS